MGVPRNVSLLLRLPSGQVHIVDALVVHTTTNITSVIDMWWDYVCLMHSIPGSPFLVDNLSLIDKHPQPPLFFSRRTVACREVFGIFCTKDIYLAVIFLVRTRSSGRYSGLQNI